MDKSKVINAIRQELEEQQVPCGELEEQPGLQWFLPLSEAYEQDYAVGELFFASDVTQEEMDGVDLAQINLIFARELPAERVDALRAFFAKVNRLISGGRFDAQEEESCFAEYGHDLVLPLDLSDEQAANAIAVAMDLASAYIRFVYEGVRGIAAGDWTVEAAMETVYQESGPGAAAQGPKEKAGETLAQRPAFPPLLFRPRGVTWRWQRRRPLPARPAVRGRAGPGR